MSDLQKAANAYIAIARSGSGIQIEKELAFLAGAAWQRERDAELAGSASGLTTSLEEQAGYCEGWNAAARAIASRLSATPCDASEQGKP